jgi:ankyrin repeat protein
MDMNRMRRAWSAGADVNAKDEGGWTLAMYAAEGGDPECLARLIEAGSDLSIKNWDQDTALMLAQKKGYDQCVERIRSALEVRALKESVPADLLIKKPSSRKL